MAILFKYNPHDICQITSPFGVRKNPVTGKTSIHKGVDIGSSVKGKEGDALYAVADGIVEISKIDGAGLHGGFGYYIQIRHNGYSALYGHIQKLEVRVGDKIKAGQTIAHMGNTGASTGPHLHFGIKVSDWIDPLPYLFKKQPQRPQIPDVILKRGSKNKESIRQLQTLLNQKQNAGLTVDGIFGAATEKSAQYFQKAKGLFIDGIVGLKTWGALLE